MKKTSRKRAGAQRGPRGARGQRGEPGITPDAVAALIESMEHLRADAAIQFKRIAQRPLLRWPTRRCLWCPAFSMMPKIPSSTRTQEVVEAMVAAMKSPFGVDGPTTYRSLLEAYEGEQQESDDRAEALFILGLLMGAESSERPIQQEELRSPEFHWPPQAIIRADMRSHLATHGLAETLKLVAEVAAESTPEPGPILAEHGRRIAALERQLSPVTLERQ